MGKSRPVPDRSPRIVLIALMQNHGYLKPGIKSIFNLFFMPDFKPAVASGRLSPQSGRNYFHKCATFSP
jgi:hypothetical protein